MSKKRPVKYTAYEFGGAWFVGRSDYDAGWYIHVGGWPKEQKKIAEDVARLLNSEVQP